MVDIAENAGTEPATIRDVRLVGPVNLTALGPLARRVPREGFAVSSWFSEADRPYEDAPAFTSGRGFVIQPDELAGLAVQVEVIDPSRPATARQLEVVYTVGDEEFTELTGVSHRWEPAGCGS